MVITAVTAREVFDSRGTPTLEVELRAGALGSSAIVPSGASTGFHEARELRDRERRLFGKGVRTAAANVTDIIGPKLVGRECEQRDIDALLIEMDGTENKSRLGANATLGVSLAASRLGAALAGRELYEYIGTLAGQRPALPIPLLNVINGGKHAGSKLAVQEFMIIPYKAESFREAFAMAAEVYHELREQLRLTHGPSATNVGDEGGFVPHIERTGEALEEIWKAIEELGYGTQFILGIDAAATSFFKDGTYLVEGRKSSEELIDFYGGLIDAFPLRCIEDPFYEDDFLAFAELARQNESVLVVGDDLLATNVQRIKQALEMKACNGAIIKPNQAGTLTETLDAARLAMHNGWRVIVSHRSGETEDTFIADLAVGLGCGTIKTGAPARGERTAKYNRLLRIAERVDGYASWKKS